MAADRSKRARTRQRMAIIKNTIISFAYGKTVKATVSDAECYRRATGYLISNDKDFIPVTREEFYHEQQKPLVYEEVYASLQKKSTKR